MEPKTRSEKNEINKKRQELAQEIFEESTSNATFTKIILSFLLVCTLAFSAFLIYRSFDKINQLYYVVNAILIFLVVLSAIIAFKKLYHDKKTSATAFTTVLLIILIAFNALSLTNVLKLPTQSYVPDFTNKELTKGIKWSEENKIKTKQIYEYSDTIKKYNIISQTQKSGTLSKKIKEIAFEVSNGPDYNKEVIINNMEGLNIDEAVKVIDENLLNNVFIEFVENNDVIKDTIISQNISGKIKRNDKLSFTVSLGNKENLKAITLDELKNQTLFKATLYLNRNGIDYELKYEFSNKIEKGKVIKSSISKGTKVSPGDKIVLTISKGKKIVVPDLKKKKLSYVTNWATENNLKLEYSDKYDNTIKNGYVIDSTYKKGDVIEEETKVGIIVSKGKLIMPKFKTAAEFKAWAEKYKIKYEIKEEFDESIKAGEIIKFSAKTGESIDTNKNIIAYVSKGKAIEVPNFSGQSKTSIQSTCSKLNITCNFTYEYSTKTENTAINQSVKAGEKVAEGSIIKITLASKAKARANTSSNTNNHSSSGSSSGGNSGGSTPTCKNYTLNLGYGSTGQQTVDIITGQNPNLKFAWTKVSACSNGDHEPGTICSSSVADGTTVSSCTTIRITYVQ